MNIEALIMLGLEPNWDDYPEVEFGEVEFGEEEE